jgi:DNA-binding NtrC family response regulator
VVLLVDDEDAVRDSCARILALSGFQVLHARDGLQAIEAFRANQGKIDIVLLDMVMPRMGGVETFRMLRSIDPEVSVLLTSGYTEATGVDALLSEGAVGFLRKPFDPDVLVQQLTQTRTGS